MVGMGLFATAITYLIGRVFGVQLSRTSSGLHAWGAPTILAADLSSRSSAHRMRVEDKVQWTDRL